MTTFFQIFINDILNKEHPEITELKDPKFRSYLIKHLGHTQELVNLLRQGLISTLRKPQRFLLGDENFYVACDLYTNTYYICFKEIMCIDIDIPKSRWKTKKEYLEFLESWYEETGVFRLKFMKLAMDFTYLLAIIYLIIKVQKYWISCYH